MRSFWRRHAAVIAVVLGACNLTISGSFPASAEATLHSFKAGNDGNLPFGAPIADGAGNLYGTTTEGGGGSNCEGIGCGTVYKIAPDGSESILYAFQGNNDGAVPWNGLLIDGSGNLYGAAGAGGSGSAGTIFEISPTGSETTLYSFQGGADGQRPNGSLVQDASGNFYGTTREGGYSGNTDCEEFGCGTVFELQADGNKNTIYSFVGGSDGNGPSSVVRDSSGNLYGSTLYGGGCSAYSSGCGTVFKIASDGTESILYAFQGGPDGLYPSAGLVLDAAGNLYGTTSFGGDFTTCTGGGCGTVFEVSPAGVETVLYAFKGPSDGLIPLAGLIRDKAGNLYGTTEYGGGSGCQGTGDGCGAVFKIAPDGTESLLFSFRAKHGKFPTAPLLLKKGSLYGTTSAGGANNYGVVFKLTK